MINTEQELIQRLIDIQDRFQASVDHQIALKHLRADNPEHKAQLDMIVKTAQNSAQAELDRLDLSKLDLENVEKQIRLTNYPRDDKRDLGAELEQEVEFMVSPEGPSFKSLKAFENSDLASPDANKKKRRESTPNEPKEILNSKLQHQLKYKLSYKPGQKPRLTAAPAYRPARPRPPGM